MKDLYTGINGFKNCCQLMGNLVKEEKGDVLADPHGILYWLMKNHLCQLLNVYWINDIGKRQCEFYSRTGQEGPEGEQKYSRTIFFNHDTKWGWVVNAILCPGKKQDLLYKRLDAPEGWSGWEQKISAQLGFDP